MKEIKVRYGGKCAKCGREIKVGWAVSYDPADKSMYCKDCVPLASSFLPQDVPPQDVPPTPEATNETLDQIIVMQGMLSNLGLQLTTLQQSVNELPKSKAKAKVEATKV